MILQCGRKFEVLLNKVSFAEKLRRWRGARPQKEAAYLLGIPQQTLSSYETGNRTPHQCGCMECLERKMLLTAPPMPKPTPLQTMFSATGSVIEKR
jgi:hypothetical protein